MFRNIIKYFIFIVFVTLTNFSFSAQPTDTSSSYITDTQDEYVSDMTTELISTANEIFCYMANTSPELMLGKGRYVAFVDESQCSSSGKGDASDSSSSSSGNSVSYTRMSMTVTSSGQNMVGKGHAEIFNDDDGSEIQIFIHASASGAPSDSSPNGNVTINFAGQSSGSTIFRGKVSSSGQTVTFSETGGDYSTRLYVTGDTDSGSGAIFYDSTSGTDTTLTFGYDSQYFCRSDGSNTYCFDRRKSLTARSVWRYGVYDDNTGARYDIANPGFTIKNSSGEYGYAGYWGIWFATGTTDGQAVTKASDNTAYTVDKTGGKLYKYTKTATTLNAIKNIPFYVYASSAVSPASGVTINSGTQYEVYWNESSFVVTGKIDCSSGSGCFKVVEDGADNDSSSTTDQLVTAAEMNSLTSSYGVETWAESIGGMLKIGPSVLSGGTPGTGIIHYLAQETVLPGDTSVPSTLYCVYNCINPSNVGTLTKYTSTQSNTNSPYNNATWNKYGNTADGDKVTYTWDSSAYTLSQSGSVISSDNMPSKSELSSTPFNWGVRTGALVPASAVADGGALDCDGATDGDLLPNGLCNYLSTNLTEYYEYEIGRQDWHSGTYLMDSSNNYYAFSPPERATFVVPSGTAYGTYAGSTLGLLFEGFGELHGIPGKCFSKATNEEADCSTDSRYVPAFSIPEDSDGYITINGTVKWVKWLERELRFQRDTAMTGSARITDRGITLGDTNNLPDAMTSSGGDSEDPSLTTGSNYAGSYPTAAELNESPSIIHGILQE